MIMIIYQTFAPASADSWEIHIEDDDDYVVYYNGAFVNSTDEIDKAYQVLRDHGIPITGDRERGMEVYG